MRTLTFDLPREDDFIVHYGALKEDNVWFPRLMIEALKCNGKRKRIYLDFRNRGSYACDDDACSAAKEIRVVAVEDDGTVQLDAD